MELRDLMRFLEPFTAHVSTDATGAEDATEPTKTLLRTITKFTLL